MPVKIAPEDYVFRFGRYNEMRAVDVAEIYKVDKDGEDVPVGLKYLIFLVEKCDWFRDTDIIKQVMGNAGNAMSEEADSEPEPEPQPKRKKRRRIKSSRRAL